jgi:hypothetical protein
LVEPVALTIHFQDMDMMGEPIFSGLTSLPSCILFWSSVLRFTVQPMGLF